PVGALERAEVRAPHVERDRPEVDDVPEARAVVDNEVIDVAPGGGRVDALGPDPRRDPLGGVLLEERFPGDPVRVAGEHERPVLEVWEQEGCPARRAPRPSRSAETSRTQSSGCLSSRNPRKVGWRIPPSSVHSVNRTSQTSFGSTQWWPRPAGVPVSNGEVARASGASLLATSASVGSSNPVPTFET